MAHFAELDKDNKVLRVIVVSNDETHDENGTENEALGIAFCKKLFGVDTRWIQTSYSGSKRGIFAGEGMTYDEKNDEFLPDTTGVTGTAEEVFGITIPN
jgi:hypothetical protein